MRSLFIICCLIFIAHAGVCEPTKSGGVSLSISYEAAQRVFLLKLTNNDKDVQDIHCISGIPSELSFEVWFLGRGYNVRPKEQIELTRTGAFFKPDGIQIDPGESHIFKIPIKELASDFGYEEAREFLEFKKNDVFRLRVIFGSDCSPLTEISKNGKK